ncbi:MAG: M1 family metallopeptidase [Akkermansiaceae bacterium]
MKFFALFMGMIGTTLSHPIEFHKDPFRQLEEVWPTPTEVRLASGAPGPKYWQQRADYDIKIELNEKKQHLTGSARITYHNQSPHSLRYLWVQLDRNRYTPNSHGNLSGETGSLEGTSTSALAMILNNEKFDGGFHIDNIVTDKGGELGTTTVDTMMRIDLPQPLKPKQSFSFRIAWNYRLNDSRSSWGRSNSELFSDGNRVHEIAQWFPRMAVYNDVRGWQNKAFLGRGEFALEFGDYKVAITVPSDHIVSATGELTNARQCLKPEWQKRLKKAENAKNPVMIITREEAEKNSKTRAKDTKTWVFEAKNVRDFAWASSRKFVWDAVKHQLPGTNKKIWAMSLYPTEFTPLWKKYSTHAIIHTLNVFSKYTFDYPYPVAISIGGPVWGMEYPMICFNGPRPEEDGTYSERSKNSLISIVIHEVGHNWFPMIVNSDERQWTWMDEGLTSFMQTVAEQEWKDHYPSRGMPQKISRYMTSRNQVPIMTNSESIQQFGPNAYTKPAVGLGILRETIMGRELFDHAFKEYSRRWMFKHPEPSDFFRTMEDAAGIDLDWFWHSWFYTTKHVDLAVTDIKRYLLDDGNPENKAKRDKEADKEAKSKNISKEHNKRIPKYTNGRKDLRDFYDKLDRFEVTDEDKKAFTESMAKLEPHERKLFDSNKEFQIVTFQNNGGVIMPLLVDLHFEKGKKQTVHLPAEIWKKNFREVKKLFVTKEPLVKVVIDPGERLGDTNMANNVWPPEIGETLFTPKPRETKKNEMQKARDQEEEEKEKKAQSSKKDNKSQHQD